MFSPLALLQIPTATFKLYMDAIVWAFKHTMRNVAEIGQPVIIIIINNNLIASLLFIFQD